MTLKQKLQRNLFHTSPRTTNSLHRIQGSLSLETRSRLNEPRGTTLRSLSPPESDLPSGSSKKTSQLTQEYLTLKEPETSGTPGTYQGCLECLNLNLSHQVPLTLDYLVFSVEPPVRSLRHLYRTPGGPSDPIFRALRT